MGVYRDVVRHRTLEVRRAPIPDDDPIRTIVPKLVQESGQVCKLYVFVLCACTLYVCVCLKQNFTHTYANFADTVN